MNNAGTENQLNGWLYEALIRIPVVSVYVKQRGAAFVFSYLHRISALLIVGFIGFHLVTLQALTQPAIYDARMRIYTRPLWIFMEWALAFPVMFHALNGGRVILFESFGYRNETVLLNWVIGLWLLFCGLLGVTILVQGQALAAVVFWLWGLAGSLSVVYIGWRKIWPTAHRTGWKLQRLSGLFLLILVPAHLFFMHLNPTVAKDATTVLARLQHPFLGIVDGAMAVTVLGHGAYGLVSIASDYIAGRAKRRMIALMVTVVTFFLGWLAIRLLLLGLIQ